LRAGLVAIVLVSGVCKAQASLTWTGATDTNWSTPSNWTPPGPPNPGDLVTISGAPNIVMDIDGDLGSMTVASTASFTSVGGVLGIGAGGLTRTGGTSLTFDATMAIILTASQTWSFAGGQNTVAGNISGTGFLLTKSGLGSLTFSGDNTQLTAIDWNGGTLFANSSGALSSAFTLTSGTLNLGAANTTDYTTSVVADGATGTINAQTAGNRYTIGTLTVNTGTNLTLGGLTGAAGTILTVRGLTLNGTITKTNLGTALWVAGPVSGTGSATVRMNGANPSGSGLDQGLHITQTNTMSLPISNGGFAGTATILGADSGATLTYTGALTMGASGTLVLTPRTSGIIVLGTGSTVSSTLPILFRGDGTGTVRLNSAFVFPAVDLTVDGLTWETNASSLPTNLTFTGGIWAVRTAAQTLTGAATFNGGTTLDTGTDLTLSGSLSGAGAITKTGAGTLTIATGGAHSGGITMAANGGSVVVSANLTSEGAVSVGANDTLNVGGTLTTSGVAVASGGIITGAGTINGGVNVAVGASFTPGSAGAGTLTTGGLVLADTTALNFTLGTTSTSASVGALTLDGVLNVSAGLGFGQGTFTLFTYSGAVTNNSLRSGSLPSGFSYAYLASGGQVVLTVGPPATAVVLAGAKAVTGQGMTQVSWQAGTEIGNLGYRLYREVGGRRVEVSGGLIAGSALFAGGDLMAGRDYTFTDPAGYAGARYWVEALDLKGRSEWFGPVQSSAGALPGKQVQEAMLVTNVGAGPLTLQTGPTPKPVDPVGDWRSWTDQNVSRQWPIAESQAVKLLVRQDGVYRVSADALLAAGFPSGTPLSGVQLWAGGRQVAFRVLSANGDTLQPGDVIEFFGQAEDTRYTDTRVYWVTAGLGAPTLLGAAASAQASSTASSFLETLEIRERSRHINGLKNPDTDGFFGKAIVGTQPMSRIFSTPAIDLTSAEPVILEISLQGLTLNAHAVDVQVNGTTVGTVQSVFQDVAKASFTLPAGALLAGDNTVTLVGHTAAEIAVEISQRLTYPRLYTMSGPLRFTAAGGAAVQLLGAAAPGAHVLDITIASVPSAVASTAGSTTSSFTVPGSGNRVLYAYRDQDVLTPAVLANVPSRWHSAPGADLVIIGARALLPSLQPLADARTSEGLKVALVDVEDVYDEFSAGVKDATAIRSFLLHAALNWSIQPRFVLLAGAATYDPRGWLGQPELDQVPTIRVQTQYAQYATQYYMETASDDALVTFAPGGPALAIGRLPLSTPADMDVAVAKILSRKMANRDDSLLLVRDNDLNVVFSAASAEVRSALSTWNAKEFVRGTDDVAAHSALLDAIRGGPIAVDYQGHGAEDFWNGRILGSTDVDALAHAGSSSLMVAATCLNAYFVDIGRESLGAAMLRVPEGGAWAVWASSAMTLPTEHPMLSKTVLTAVLNDGLTLGEATLKAKRAVTDQNLRATFHLLGDPSARAVATRSPAVTVTSSPKAGSSGCSTTADPFAALAPLVLLALGLSIRRRPAH
jgi:uncharacterized protein (TIGR03382 family)